MRASGVRPRAAASAADITTTAAAPSLSPGALPAVTVPVRVKAGFSARERHRRGVLAHRFVAIDDDRRRPSSAAIVTGRISSREGAGWRCAATAFLWLAAA